MADVVYFVRDMLFTSKVREAAKALGLEAKAPATLDPATLVAAAEGAKLVVFDLRLDAALPALAALLATPATPGRPAPRTVGFVDHERLDVMDAARAAGCSTVLTKGQLAGQLPALLGSVAASSRSAT